MITTKSRLQALVYGYLQDAYALAPGDIEFTVPPQAAMGDLALTLPFQTAKKQRTNPRAMAQDMMARLGPLPGVARMEVAGPGFINLFLDQDAFFAERRRALGTTALRPAELKVIVEHTNINPNKAAHIGHLRNACLGDTLVRALRFKGETVEAQNYIDDTGVQVVDVVFGVLELEKKTQAALERIERFDFYCWDLYARTAAYLETDPAAQARKAEMLKAVEHGRGPEGAMARYVSRRILRAHLATMKRIGASYDVLPCESSIIGLKFWDKAFALLKEKKGISFVEDGPNAGCWVMKLEDEEDKEKIIVRSNGTVTYVGKDIAYQMWKFGLLEQDFYYDPFLEDEGRPVWISTAEPNDRGLHFGGGTRVYNVIDTRQSYLQKVVVQGLRALQFDAQADKSVHFSYEMVALSPRSMKELGVTIAAEDADKAFHEVSGRKGLGVKADDLLDRLEEKAFAEADKRNPDLPPEAKRRTARRIARGSLRYFMLKFARNSLLIFDFDEALSFEGETGPYLQYTCVRLNSIFRKLEDREGTTAESVDRMVRGDAPSLALLPEGERTDAWELLTFSAQFDDEVLRSIESLEFSHTAKFAFALAQKCNGYYHKYPILSEPEADLKTIRILVVAVVSDVLVRALDLMGIPGPERM
ncbi:MAG: arginine--tRNA ligase [Candidatus Aminicenantales bacterium]|jgi:arginyl-tRNA synthetase